MRNVLKTQGRGVGVALLLCFFCGAHADQMTPAARQYLQTHLNQKGSAISRISEIIDRQNLTYYRPGGSGAAALALNGRALQLTVDDFIQVIANTLLECQDVGNFVGNGGSSTVRACENGIVAGFKDWVNVAANHKISESAWYCGAQATVLGSDSNPDVMRIDFGGWAGMARVCQGRMNRGR